MDQSKVLPDLVQPETHDPFSSAVRLLSQNLTKLDLRVTADSTLFWPSSTDTEAPQPSWPHLRRLRVEFHPATPRGTWYFAGPRGEGRDAVGYAITGEHYPPLAANAADKLWDEIWNYEGGRAENIAPDMFRTERIRETIEPLLKAFARALGSMPALEEAELFTYLRWMPSADREDGYEDRGEEAPFDPENGVHRWGVRYMVSEERAAWSGRLVSGGPARPYWDGFTILGRSWRRSGRTFSFVRAVRVLDDWQCQWGELRHYNELLVSFRLLSVRSLESPWMDVILCGARA